VQTVHRPSVGAPGAAGDYASKRVTPSSATCCVIDGRPFSSARRRLRPAFFVAAELADLDEVVERDRPILRGFENDAVMMVLRGVFGARTAQRSRALLLSSTIHFFSDVTASWTTGG
jgi:hypothetical protein